MADSLFGDIGQVVGGVAGEMTPTTAAIGNTIGNTIGEAMGHLDIDVNALTAGLSHDAAGQVIEATHDLAAPTAEQVDDLVQKAQDAESHRVEAEALQHQQAKAAEEGDYARAHELQHNAEYNLQIAADSGAHVGAAVSDAQKEGAALDNANWQQQTAHEASQDAASYAASGDAHNASASAHVADDHASTAADYGHAGDHGGSTVSHDSSADTTHDVSSTSE